MMTLTPRTDAPGVIVDIDGNRRVLDLDDCRALVIGLAKTVEISCKALGVSADEVPGG